MTGMDIAIVIVVVILAAVLFTVWLAAQLFMLVVRGITAIVRPTRAAATASSSTLPVGWSACNYAGCNAANPDHARFCRRCGKMMAGGRNAVPMRYVA